MSHLEALKNIVLSRTSRESSACWLWTGAVSSNGYGRIGLRGKHYSAHRASYMVFHGEIPPGVYVMHSCDVPLCCNPAHLSVGAPKQNTRDALVKRRLRPGNSKLSWELAEALKVERNSGASLKDLQQKYGVNRTTIWAVAAGKHWAAA